MQLTEQRIREIVREELRVILEERAVGKTAQKEEYLKVMMEALPDDVDKQSGSIATDIVKELAELLTTTDRGHELPIHDPRLMLARILTKSLFH